MREPTRRVLIVDDNRAIHADFREMLASFETPNALDEPERPRSAPAGGDVTADPYEIDSAFQGEEALAMVRAALAAGRPYAVAFVDMSLPAGWDGFETIRHIRSVDASLQLVLCSGFSGHSWSEIAQRLDRSDGLLILKKPFDYIEAVQLASTLTRKWTLHRELQQRMEYLEATVQGRTAELERSNRALLQTIYERQRIEGELRLAQKLEAVGRLASGIAHEINSPVQFASDSIAFVRDVLGNLWGLHDRYRKLVPFLATHTELQPLLAELLEAEERADVDYASEQVPKAIDRALLGLDRIATLVRSLKRFAEPDTGAKAPADLNEAIASTLIIAHNEYKYVADLDTDYGVLPPVSCHIGEINQVVLSVLINAAHAVADVVDGSDSRGRISLSTRAGAEDVVIAVSDTGAGIAPAIRDKIFDPFFSTKDVGRGSGQSLAMARAVVVEKHGGSISFETAEGRGTTFFIRLPIRTATGSE